MEPLSRRPLLLRPSMTGGLQLGDGDVAAPAMMGQWRGLVLVLVLGKLVVLEVVGGGEGGREGRANVFLLDRAGQEG